MNAGFILWCLTKVLDRVQNIYHKLIKDWARQVGFDLVGIAPAEVADNGQALRSYLERGYQGSMNYLERNIAQRLDPCKLMPTARSIICVALNYYAPEPDSVETVGNSDKQYGKIARYAWGEDYHNVVKQRLHQLADLIRKQVGPKIKLRCFVDTAPLLEKAHAARAGLGWIGKNSLLLNEQFGSWLVLGEIVTDLELEYDQPVADKCGDCQLCLESCPTGALLEPRILEARRCISYLTIEAKHEIPAQLQGKTGNWLFGCDICQNVCPYNQKPQATNKAEFHPRPRWCRIELQEILQMSEEQFQKRFAGNCLQRAGWEHMLHNAKITLQNREHKQ